MFMANHLIGFGASSSLPHSDIYQPAGTTALFRMSFAADVSTFDTNSISASASGSLTWNATGGRIGGYASAFSLGGNMLSHSDVLVGSASSASWVTMMAWVKTTSSAAATGSGYGPGVYIFGDSSGSITIQFGVTDGKISGASAGAQKGATSVNDGNWHHLAWKQTGQQAWNMWVDGVIDGTFSGGDANNANRKINKIGSGYTPYGADAPIAMDGIQIYAPSLTNAQIQEIYAQS